MKRGDGQRQQADAEVAGDRNCARSFDHDPVSASCATLFATNHLIAADLGQQAAPYLTASIARARPANWTRRSALTDRSFHRPICVHRTGSDRDRSCMRSSMAELRPDALRTGSAATPAPLHRGACGARHDSRPTPWKRSRARARQQERYWWWYASSISFVEETELFEFYSRESCLDATGNEGMTNR